MAFIRTTSETTTDNLLVEIDVNAYNEIEVDIKRSGLCVYDESLTSGLSGNGSNESCTGSNTGFRSVVKRSLTLEKEVSRLKWREEYLTVCEDGSICNAGDRRTAAVPCMKNEDSEQCFHKINNKAKYFRENSESLLKSKEYKGMYLVTNSNMSHAQETQEATFYVKKQGKNNLTSCQQGFTENDLSPKELYKDETDTSFASQSEEVKIRAYTKKGPKGINNDVHNLHPVSYPQNQVNYMNEVDVKNTLNDVMAKSILIEEIGKKLIKFLGSAIGQKLMKEYSNGKQKSDFFSASGNLLDPTFSVDMGRIKMIVDEICNAIHTQNSVKLDEDSSELQQNPQNRSRTKKFYPKDCLLTERSTPRNNTEGRYSIKTECSGALLDKNERKVHHLNLKQSNRLHRNRYNRENYKRNCSTEGSRKPGISVDSSDGNNRHYTSVPSVKMDSEKKSFFSTVKETFNALLKNKLFENCTEKHTSSAQNKAEHQSVRVERRSHSSGIPQKSENSQTGAKCKNGFTLIDRGSHLSSRKVIKISKQTSAAAHTKTYKKSENHAPEYEISKPRKKSKVPYSVTPKTDKPTKWRKDDFQKLLFELLETLCSKIKKKDLQRLSVLLDILMKLQDQNLSTSVENGNCTEMVACYNIEQHTEGYSQDSSMRQLHTITSNKQNIHEACTEGEEYEASKAFFETRNSNCLTKYKKCIQSNVAHNSKSSVERNSKNEQVHAKFVANRNQSRAVQTKFQSRTDTLSVSNLCSNNIQLREDLEVPMNHVINKKNNNCKDCPQFSGKFCSETVVEGKIQSTSNTRQLLSDCRVRQYDPETYSLATKEGKNINSFLSVMRASEANQSYSHLNSSVMSWQGTDGKVKCPIYERENSYECSHQPAANIDKINKIVTIMGLSEAYEMYNKLTSSDVCLKRTDSKSKQICNPVPKVAAVSTSLYKHAAIRQDSSNVTINKVNGVGVKINIPFSNQIFFPKSTEYFKKSLKTGGTLKFYLPFTIKSNNCMELIAIESGNKDSRYAFENEKDKSITDNVEINLLKEECVSETKCSPNSYFMASNECVMLQRAVLHNTIMEHPQCNEQEITVCQSVDHKVSACNEVESADMLHRASSILLIESPSGKQTTHTNNCYSFQYSHKPLSPWKLENQVGSFMFGACTTREYPVTNSLCAEDYLDGLGDHMQGFPKTNLMSPCDIKTFDFKIIRETSEHEIPNSRKTITKQLPTYFVFSAHNIKTNKEKMHSHITRKTKKQNRNIHDPQSSRSNEPWIRQSHASYYQRPSICLEPTICAFDPPNTRPQTNDKKNNIPSHRSKRDKILHYQNFPSSNSPSKPEKKAPYHSSKDLKNVNVVPTKSISSIASQRPLKSVDKKVDTKELIPSSIVLIDDTSKREIPCDSVTNSPNQQSLESFDSNSEMELNISSSDTDQFKNIDHQETERSDILSENEVHTPLLSSKLEETKSPAMSVSFKCDQRERVYPMETSSETSEEELIKPQDSDHFPVKKNEAELNIVSSENELNGNRSHKRGLSQNHEYSTEESHKKNHIKSLERIKILSQIDADDMAKQAASQAATHLDNVHTHTVSGTSDGDKHSHVSLEPQSSSEICLEPVVPKDSILMAAESKDVNCSVSNVDDPASVNSKNQKKDQKTNHKKFSQKNVPEENKELSMRANADMQPFSTPYQFGNAEEQNKNMKQATLPNEKREEGAKSTTHRRDGSEHDKWRLSQTRRLIKTHHALIREAHEINVEKGDTDGSDNENKAQKIKIGKSTWNSCTPADFLLYFRRGFRDDQMTLNNKVCFVERLDLLSSDQESSTDMIDLMLTCHPLDFLVQLGYSAEEAAIISQDEEIKCRLYAAIREARIWANAITKPQAALLYLLAHKAKPKIMRYYLCLVESIINRRIMNAVKLNELIDFLECLEDGEIALKDIFEDLAESDALEEKKKTEDLYTVFHQMAEEEAMNCGRYPLSAKQIFLLQTLVSKYHIALQDHLELLTRYIGRGLIKNTIQLEAALVYLPHVGRHTVNIQEFEQYCGIKPKKIKTEKLT